MEYILFDNSCRGSSWNIFFCILKFYIEKINNRLERTFKTLNIKDKMGDFYIFKRKKY